MLLKDLFVFLPKSKRSASYGKPEGKYPFFTSSNTIDKYVDEPDYNGSYLIIGDGGTGNCKYYDGEFSASDHNYIMFPKKGTNPRCVQYFLAKDNFQVLNEGFKGIGIKNVSKAYIENIDYRHNQKFSEDYICQTLGKIEELINKEMSVLTFLDELTKSRFNELFMHRSLQKNRLVDVSLSSGEYGACSASVEYDVNRPRYVRITDINDDGTLNDDLVSSKVLSDDNEYRLSYGDFLFARMGATVGKTYAFYSGNQIYAGYLIKYKLDLSKINPRYLYWYTKQNEYWDWVKIKQSGAAQPGINAKKYDLLEIPLAPIKEQDEFAAFVKQVDKLKFNFLLYHHQMVIIQKYLSFFYSDLSFFYKTAN